ncbi:TPA: alpha/beta hydrolase [Serratia marcescens]
MGKIYRGMSEDELNAEYNLRDSVDDYDGLIDSFRQRSRETYQKQMCARDVAYGPAPRNKFDFFPCLIRNAPTVIFIHGGYWQATEKETYAFIVDGLIDKFNVILPEYTLAPEAGMTTIVEEIGTFLDFLNEQHGKYNITSGRVCLAGHSAGGHLAALYREHPVVSHLMPLSALVDLEPIRLTTINNALDLTDEEVAMFSPVKNKVNYTVPAAIHVGDLEPSELIRHSEIYAQKMISEGNPLIYSRLKNRNHFTLLDEFDVHGVLTYSLRYLFRNI